ncbi:MULTISPECIES: hypothetical protein [Fusobacterium]|jgi:hypothetical protein|uniref:Uncharacterized protein n=4 Tax=Fusobacterium TaxID=848 RepID=A0A0S2ZQY6_9FUSO|nr:MULTISPECIES: hypothetical protein [Fusobacterium]ALQ35385.1 hypothetical protein RN92_05600 [Fusobacterium hwasookii ChDC F206]ALQ37978.1 hypothetical protein RN97_07070 [Fusobacterium hwasookii ChDC F300]ALQ41209.1 hypothetical protein RN87_11660 [Fusobacterium hwasookii ChDC F174]ASG28352.1 hypothetical protein CBG61_05035 [Fusobacterium polymorphum]ETZ29608.1 hypothetical protein HMPREF2085_00426 [Fusobacterium nucleatum 13_3C]
MTLNPIKIIKNVFRNRTKFFLQMVNTLNTGITEIKSNSKERGKKYISLFNKKEDILYLMLGIIFGVFISFLNLPGIYKYIIYLFIFIFFYILKKLKKVEGKEIVLESLKILLGVLISSFFYSIYFLVKGTLL